MRSFATTRSGTASFAREWRLLHWQLSIGHPHVAQTRPRSVE
jgi:hypothetical protein